MANISLLSRLVNGVQRQVDLSANTLVVLDLQINGINLRSTGSGTAGSTGIGDDNSYLNFTPSAATIKGALSGIDAALGSGSGTFANRFLSNLTSPTAINQDLLPSSANTKNLGSSASYWLALYVSLIKDSSNVTAIDVLNRALKDTAGASQFTWSTSGVQLTANPLDFNSHKGVNVTDPTNPQDIATKNYVDNLAHGLSWKQVVRSATTGALPAYTYANGTAGVGATITATSNGALPAQDGVTLVVNDRLLVKDETAGNQPYNGIYTVTQVGSGGTPFILTRATDCNTAAEITWFTVEVGADPTTQAGYIFRESADITTVGTDNVTVAIISHGLDWTFNNGLSVTGNQVNVAPGDTSLTATTGSLIVRLNAAGAIVTSSGLMINLATSNPGLQISSNQLDVKYNPAGAIVASSTGIAWNPDGSSLEISSNAARIKTTAYDQSTITGGGGSAAAVQFAPSVKFTGTAGQTFAANTTYALRYGLTSNGETAGRLYAADTDTSSFDLFWVVGFLPAGAGFVAGNTITVVQEGILTLGSSDTNFGGTDTGKALFLQAGGINPTTTAPTVTGKANAVIGMCITTTTFKAMVRAPYVY